MTDTISNRDDIIDSRDIIARIEELESEIEAIKDKLEEDPEFTVDDAKSELEEPQEELKHLKSLANEGEGYSDWKHGATLIRDSYFPDYAEELASDIGAINSELSWPYTCIDWEKAARELQGDYTSIDYDGVTYWVR